MKAVNITLGKPAVVAQAPIDLDRAAAAWGRWQFPWVRRLRDGRLHASFYLEPASERKPFWTVIVGTSSLLVSSATRWQPVATM